MPRGPKARPNGCLLLRRLEDPLPQAPYLPLLLDDHWWHSHKKGA